MTTNGILASQSKALLLSVLALALSVPSAAQKRPSDPKFQGQGALKVMTYNMDVGTDYVGMQTAILGDFKQAASNMVDAIRASDPAGRAQAVARQIARANPHLVSLQEVATLSTGATKGNLVLEFDYLQLLLDALAAEGLHYTAVDSWMTWDATVPTLTGYARNTWSEAVLARADLDPADFFFTNIQHGNWTLKLPVTLPALNGNLDCPVPLKNGACAMKWPRGWASADVFYRGKSFRIIGAHLESAVPAFEIAQALELLAGPANTVLPVIVAADLNCDCSDANDPMHPTCENFTKAGFVDAWAALHTDPGDVGYTKHLPGVTQRSDYVMVRGPFAVQAAIIVGDKDGDKTASGLWPSDHAGVVVRLQMPGED